VAKWVDPLKGKLFGAVTLLKFGLAEFSHPLDECLQAQCHLRFLPFIFNMWRKEMFVHPLGFDVYVNVEPLLGGTLLAAPKLSVHVLLPTVATQCQADPREDLPIIVGEIIEVPE
jgi:hypothetical protein